MSKEEGCWDFVKIFYQIKIKLKIFIRKWGLILVAKVKKKASVEWQWSTQDVNFLTSSRLIGYCNCEVTIVGWKEGLTKVVCIKLVAFGRALKN